MADIKSIDLVNEIGDILTQYGQEVSTIVDEEISKIARSAVKELKQGNGGFNDHVYSSSWKSKKERLFGGLYSKVTVYNAKHYQLTHLLEKGHRVVAWKKDLGKRTRAFPHISVVNDRVGRELPDAIIKRINKL